MKTEAGEEAANNHLQGMSKCVLHRQQVVIQGPLVPGRHTSPPQAGRWPVCRVLPPLCPPFAGRPRAAPGCGTWIRRGAAAGVYIHSCGWWWVGGASGLPCVCPGGWLLRDPRSPRIRVVPANTDPDGPRRSHPESPRVQLLVDVVVYQISVHPIHFRHRHRGHEFGTPRFLSSPAVAFWRLLGSSQGVPRGVVPLWTRRWCGSAPVSSGAWASRWTPRPYGPGGVLSVVLVTACVPSVVSAAVGWAVAAGRCAPRTVRASVGACGSGVVGWGPRCGAPVGDPRAGLGG